MQTCDTVWNDARLVTMAGPALGVIENGVIAAAEGRLLYAGPAESAPKFQARAIVSCDGRWVTPGLIDPHTHLVYGGDRVQEFEQRLRGVSYTEIAAKGGGIASTVRATRSATDSELLVTALRRLDALAAEGVTTVEIKTGYGLSVEEELRLLRVIRTLASERRIKVVATLLAAHAVPPEYRGDADEYVRQICADLIPVAAAQHLAEAVDAFCEPIAFSLSQTEQVFKAAQACGLPVKLHAEQLSNSHGAELAARHQALSADHLEYLDEEGIAAMAHSGTVATLLPGAFYFMRETRRPPVEGLRRAGVPMALATDCNPGTSPLTSLLLTMNMAATLFDMTTDECLAGVTREAARALGLSASHGTLEAGKVCDLAIWNIEQPAELVYRMGFNPLHARVWSGQ